MTDGYRIELFDAEGTNPRLRWFPPEGEMAERRLTRKDIDEFVDRVANEYSAYSPVLTQLGADLYNWLDGPTERWLQKALSDHKPMTLHIDAQERLRELPWELMFDNSFLTIHPTRPVAPVRAVSARQATRPDPANRALRVLFMAASPVGVEPVLDFEQEEGVILAAAAGRVEVVVEESGSLAGLGAMLSWFGPDYFDVLHLSGHGYITPAGPRFVMEAADGSQSDHSAEQIGAAIEGRWPGLLFVSGCYTAAAQKDGVVASMAESLVDAGAPSVLGWALPVGDSAASDLAASLYGRLADGGPIDHAVTLARRALFDANSQDWHLLRLYADRTPLGSLVTAPGTKGRVRLRTRASSTLFLDAEGQVKVADRASFVGRRRELQKLLRELRPDDPTEGPQLALLHGMGGLGKSTLAARLLERMRTSHDQSAVWVGRIDEQEVVSLTRRLNLGDPDIDQRVNELLGRENVTLADRLRYVLDGPLADTPCVFVFDDFEDGNLESDGHGAYRCRAEALEVLRGFATAIARTGSASRVVVTSRYDFPLPTEVKAMRLPVLQLQGNDLDKKLRTLEQLAPTSPLEAAVKDRAITAAAGIPRLLERLDSLLSTDPGGLEALFTSIEAKEVEYREELLLHRLLDEQSEEVRHAISLAAVYEIAVPLDAILALSPDEPIKAEIESAVSVGLLQAGLHPSTGELRYLVSPLVRPLLAKTLERLTDDELLQAQERGARFLYELWVEPESA